ncbi:MAG TPA: hypothetical protein PLZ51_21955, partial [Aggregatilineales bacterium]|nr:hypothetical protein [Aggregatilineales bacterium]
MDTWVSIAQNGIFILALGFLYDVAHRLHSHRPYLSRELILGIVFSLMIALIHFTPVLHFTRNIHIAFVLLVYAALMGGWLTGGMSLLTYIGIDIVLLPSAITLPYIVFLLAMVALGYGLRLGYKSSVSDYTLAELSAVCLVLICLMTLIPMIFNIPSLLFTNPALYAQLVITVAMIFMLTGVVLRRTMALHQAEAQRVIQSEYEGFLAKAISDEIYEVTFSEKGDFLAVTPIFFEGENTYQNPLTPEGTVDWLKLVYSDDTYLAERLLVQLLRGEPATVECRLLESSTNSYEWRRIYGVPIMHPTKNYVHKAYFASKDISAERTAKVEHDVAQLERERVAILKAFSLQSEHQFRTPLSSIHTNLYLLRKVTDESKRARYLDVIEDQA